MAITTYTVTFKDIKNRSVVITISNGQTGQSKALTPAKNPLTTSEDNDADPMLAIRSTVAQIRVVCPHREIIPVENNLQWAVTITRANTILWRGYLRAEMPDMDYSPIPDEITYTADDILGIMKYRVKSIDGSRKSFNNLLTNTYTKIDNSIPVMQQGASATDTLTSLFAESYNWVERTEDESGTMVNRSDMQNVLEGDIAKFLGVTIRYYNNNLYFGSLYGTRYYNSGTLVIPTALDGSLFKWMGFHTISWEQGVGLINLKAVGREIETGELPDLSSKNFEVTTYGWMPPQTEQNTASGGYNCYFRSLQPTHGWTLIKRGLDNYPWGKMGGYVLDYDIWNTDISSEKYNFAFTRSLFFSGQYLAPDGTTQKVPTFISTSRYIPSEAETECNTNFYNWLDSNGAYITLRSEGEIYTKDGGLTLDVVAKVVQYTMVGSTGNRRRQVTGFADTAHYGGVFKLQFGNKYWNGTAWQTTACYFIEDHDTILKKSLDMNFQGEGMAMPISGTMTGEITLSFYGAYTFTTGSDYDPQGGYTEYWAQWGPMFDYSPTAVSWLKFDKFELIYNPPFNILDVDNDEERKLSSRTLQFPENNDDNVNLALCSAGNIIQNWGFVYKSNGDIITTLHWPKLRESLIPERLVLKKHTLALSRLRSFATLTMECEYEDLPFLRVKLDGREWFPISINTEWRDCKSEVMMLDITDIMAALPAVGTDEETTGYTRVIYVTNSNDSTTLTLSAAIDEQITIQWSAYGNSGTDYIAAGSTSVTLNTGGQIQEERDWDSLSITTPSGNYTFMLIY